MNEWMNEWINKYINIIQESNNANFLANVFKHLNFNNFLLMLFKFEWNLLIVDEIPS